MFRKVSLTLLLSLLLVSAAPAARLNLGLSGGSYVWGNATWYRAFHESSAQTGQFDLGLFVEYGDLISGRIELRYNRDYLLNNYEQDFSVGIAKSKNDTTIEEWMLPLLAKVNLPVGEKWRFTFFGGPEICLYRAMATTSTYTVTYNPPFQAYNTSGTVGNLSVGLWEPRASIGALVGGGASYELGPISLGLNLNVEFVRLTSEGYDYASGTAIDHRYNMQFDLGYTLFGGK